MDFKNGGREQGQAGASPVHDFAIPELGKAVPYGIYDVAANAGFVNVGISAYTICVLDQPTVVMSAGVMPDPGNSMVLDQRVVKVLRDLDKRLAWS